MRRTNNIVNPSFCPTRATSRSQISNAFEILDDEENAIVSNQSVRSNVSAHPAVASARPAASAARVATVIATPSVRSNVSARPAVSTARPAQAAVESVADRARRLNEEAARQFPQPRVIESFARPSQVIALEGVCLRSVLFHTCPDLKDQYKCHPDRCRRPHLEYGVKYCNSVMTYLRSHLENGIELLEAVRACTRSDCQFWPCNQRDQSVVKTAVATSADVIPLAVKEDASTVLESEKEAMKVSNPLMYSMWCDHRYRHLSQPEFREKFHTDYLSWNFVDTSLVVGAKLDEDDDEWAEETAEIEHSDHRREYADFTAYVRGITLSEDMRVLGSETAMRIAVNSDVFEEYQRAHWNFAGRPKILGRVVTFHNWLEEHPTYSAIYRLMKSGQSWQDAKKAVKGVITPQKPIVEINWDAPCINGLVVDKADSVESLKARNASMSQLLQMTASEAVVEPRTKKVRGSKQEEIREFPILEAPEFLEDVKQSETIFVCRNKMGAFEIYIQLARPMSANSRAEIADQWSQFRTGPGRASFVAVNHKMFLCISGSIKKTDGFHVMFERFPAFIAALKKQTHIASDAMCAVPVEMDRDFYSSHPAEKKWLTEKIEEESNNNSDCGFEFGPSAAVAEESETAPRRGSDAYSLVDILVYYFKK